MQAVALLADRWRLTRRSVPPLEAVVEVRSNGGIQHLVDESPADHRRDGALPDAQLLQSPRGKYANGDVGAEPDQLVSVHAASLRRP